MTRLRLILTVLAALLLAAGCSRLEQTSSLNVYVRLPEEALTKAPTVEWASLQTKEVRINDLRIWVFLRSSTDGSLPQGMLLGYLEPKQLSFSGGKVQKFSVVLDREIAMKIATVDVYVLGNAGAAGLFTVGADTTPAVLDAITLTNDFYGIASNGEPTNTTVIDNVGLPYSAVGKGLSLTGTGAELSVTSVELVRAVTKVQFAFCQIANSSGEPQVDFQITGLKLNASQISTKEYLFNDTDASYKIGDGYVDRELSLQSYSIPTKTEIAGSTSPGGFAYSPSETAADYQIRIDTALRDGAVTGCAPMYLRESDKTLSGQIRYRVGSSAEKTLGFEMYPGERFLRNSYWIVFFYFNSDDLSMSVSYVGWNGSISYEIIGG